jgi:hypothetical protein
VPTRQAALLRGLKVFAHRVLRTIENFYGGPGRIKPSTQWASAPVLAEFKSALWVDGREDEFILRCGKVQNLRAAVQAINAVEVNPGCVVSFWAQVGRPARSRGFVIGREIISGCIVPTIGGGLCQLSNALASVACEAGITCLERHPHSAKIQDATPSTQVDATVAWNYIDLRFCADFPFRLEASLTADELVVRVRAPDRGNTPPQKENRAQLIAGGEGATARGCLTCNQVSCFRHRTAKVAAIAKTAVLLNDATPELERWLHTHQEQADWLLPWVRRGRQGWRPPQRASVQVAVLAGLRRTVRLRIAIGEGRARQALRQQAAQELALAYAKRLTPLHTQLVIAQDLLVPLWRLGVLGGRTYCVYLRELPASEIQARLDIGALLWPDEKEFRDFRVDEAWQRDEWAALAAATSRLTAHAMIIEVLAKAGLSAQCLPWCEPTLPTARRPTSAAQKLTLTLAASALARKGALEVAAVARALNARVLILGSAPTNPDHWRGIEWRLSGYESDWLAQTDVALLPAYIEHCPQVLLKALAAGIPVIATTACGLAARPGLTLVAPGDVSALKVAVMNALT